MKQDKSYKKMRDFNKIDPTFFPSRINSKYNCYKTVQEISNDGCDCFICRNVKNKLKEDFERQHKIGNICSMFADQINLWKIGDICLYLFNGSVSCWIECKIIKYDSFDINEDYPEYGGLIVKIEVNRDKWPGFTFDKANVRNLIKIGHKEESDWINKINNKMETTIMEQFK